MADGAAKLRVDKWLWHARFFKTRTLAARHVSSGHVRVDGVRVSKAAFAVGPDAILTFSQAREIRVVRVLELGKRRGPASEAQALYEDLTPTPETPVSRERVGERPTKKNRRAMEAFRDV